MNNTHSNWRKFLTEGSYDESKLLQEVSDEELEYIQTAVDEMVPEDLAFNELFGGKERVIIPFSTMDDSTELGQFLTILGQFRDRDLDISSDYVPNWEKGVMEKERPLGSDQLATWLAGGPDPKKVVQSMKIGKWLAASERAIDAYAKWLKYKDDNDLGSASRPMSTDEMEKEQKMRDKLRQIVGVSHPNDLMVRFKTRRDLRNADGLREVVAKIQKLKQYWQQNADYIKKNPMGELNSDTYSIIITRNPIDVLRMSDFRNITSCHSPTSRGANNESYFKCAVAEAHGEGAIAYVVRNGELEELFDEDPKNINLDAFEQEEIFHDDFRHISTELLNPVSRIRLRLIRYYKDNTPLGRRERSGFFASDTGVDIAVPEERVYGKRIPGLHAAIMDWAKTNQSETIDNIMSQKGTLDLTKFTAFGGSYEDNSRQSLLKDLLGITQGDSPLAVQVTTGQIDVNTSTEDNLEGIGPEGDAQQLEADAQRYIEEARLEEFKVSVSAEYDEESAWLDPDIRLRLEWPADEWKSLPNPTC
jgi:ribosomal protein S15P/S13E